MTTIPILYSGPMVRALLDGRKTQTRRLAWCPCRSKDGSGRDGWRRKRGTNAMGWERPTPWQKVKPGDLLWVKEAFYLTDDGHYRRAVYVADDDSCKRHVARIEKMRCLCSDDWAATHLRKRSADSMPRWASRLTLEVTATKMERLQDISEEDARAEGLKAITKDGNLVKWGIPDSDGLPGNDDFGWPWSEWEVLPVGAFKKLWIRLHGPESWDANPQVVAISFHVIKRNIDEYLKERAI